MRLVLAALLLWASSAECQQRGLFPAILNLASNAEITTNATCGDPLPEMYCKLVEHVPGRRIRNPQCRSCDANSANPKERHPITNAIDGTNQWWQSPSIKNGRQFHWVTITLDLRQVFQVAYVIIKAANSPRPGNWILERSLDGINFHPWQYYAISDTECLTRYNITPRIGPPTYKRDEEVICTSYYSRLVPLEHGEIHTSLINGRPGADDLTPELLEFTSARFIRLRLQRIRTLNADLMTLSYRDPKDVDPIVTRRYYYSLKDISVGGMCICYGHAQSCPLDPVTKKLQCVCEHNTCGESCNECCPGYHQELWQPGTISDGNTCEKCNCHNKAEDCYYNQTVADLKMSMNTHGQFVGGGVCINCTQNTAGVNCETCADGYYRPHKVSPYANEPCLECNCDIRGSVSHICVRDDNHANPGLLPGQCLCKEGFAGERCDRCAFGYRDFPLCTHCECSLEGSHNIDPCTECICKANVMGANCDLCKQGFYNLQASNPEGCTECFCFGVSDVCESSTWNTSLVRYHTHTHPESSSVCSVICSAMLSSVSLAVADPTSRSSTPAPDVEQCECPWGYSGTSCEVGLQLVFGSCSHNTTGPHCDQCLPGYYGDPTEGTAEDCQRCACPLTLASNNFSPTCSLQGPGEVMCDQCEQGYTGAKCERCANGYYGNPTVPGQKCSVCECNGNVDTSEPGHCDSVTGECLKCVQHTSGRHCERCEDGYYGDAVTAKNCQDCGCHSNGSVSSVCNIITGQCECKASVVGDKCEHCQVGFHGINSGDGCRSCECNQSGSVSEACAEDGQCQCIVGVSGDKCDRCQHGYYNFTNNGCTPCDCAHTHGNCNAETGECICPPHTRGEKCEMCEDDHWGHDGVTGCKPCNCSAAGSNSSQCDLLSGQCACRLQFTGQKCDRCALGFRNFPECTACNCNTNGTREDFCNDGLGVCGCEDHGVCVCKDNVGGGGCDECKSGTFGLWGQNPAGCSPCFCFGVSSVCEELGGLVRVPVSMPFFVFFFFIFCHYLIQNNFTMMLLGMVASTLAGPYYWRLPQRFQGSKLLSYGGELSYSVVFAALDGSGLSNYEPQILMRGGHLRKLVIYTDMPAPEHGIRTTQRHKWKYFNAVSEKAVSHADFMSVLSNVEYIIIKASYGTGLQQSRISNISMETAVEADEAPEGTQVARLVEACECPPGYAGLSCQECAPGYYRQSVSELNMKGRNRPLIQPCVPCQCNNHSLACDLDTGKCLGCQHNTAGEHCNVCAPGYYGRVKGSISDCSICACPLQSNSFSPTCVLEGVGDFHCNACKPGYEGRYCERCALGYYGNPSEPGGKCEVCQCSETGSLHSICDAQTGKCMCKAGVRGHLCDQCDNRYVLSDDQCVSCDDECTGVLLDDVDAIEALFQSLNLSGVILAPYSLLISLENQTQELQVCEMVEPSNRMETLKENISTALNRHNQQLQEARELLNTAKSHNNHTEHLLKNIHTNIEEFTVRNSLGLCCFDNCLKSFCVLSRIYFTVVLGNWKTAYRTTKVLFTDICCLYSNVLSASAAESKLKEAQLRTERLFDRLKPLKTLGENLSRNLSEIKELINQARKQAASIKVAVSADRDCVRAYKPEVTSSNFNTLTLTVKTTEPGNLLFYMGSSSSVDFMALEMRHGKVSFLWDAGSGHAKLEYPDVQINNNKWHRINATRFGKQGSLTVQQLDSEPMPTVKTTAPGSATVMEVSKSTWVFVGGLGGQVKKSPAVKMSHFKGCMGEASLNEKNIGLWNYAEREGGCGGCFMRPLMEETSFYFDGSGYSVVEKSLRSISTSVVMFFKTLSPNGLLLYLASNGTRDFLSIELVEGRVHLTFELGSGPLTLTSTKTYNTGTWYKIALQRNKRKGGLCFSINHIILLNVSVLGGGYIQMPAVTVGPQTEIISSFSSRNSSGLILAGLNSPSGRKRRHTQQVPPHLISPYVSSLNPLTSKHYMSKVSWEPKCALTPQYICILDCRYFSILTGPMFSFCFLSSFTVELSIRTLATSGILFYMANANQQDYAVLQLQGGRLLFSCDLGKGPAITTSRTQISDGQWHTIHTILKSLLSTLISVDGVDSERTPIKGHTLDVEGKLYLGGLPKGYIAKRIGNVTHSMAGCMQKIKLNSAELSLQNAASSHQTDTCFSSVQEGSFFNGSGYATFKGYYVGSDVTVSLEFRSTALDGVLLGVSSTRVDAIGLELLNGQVVFNVNNGAGRFSAVSRSRGLLCDGRWHTLVAKKLKHSLSLTVDGLTVSTENPHSSSTSAETKNPIYVGGYPADVKQSCLSSRTSFRGCMRNLRFSKGHITDVLDFASAFARPGVSPHSCPAAPAA
uniref:Laminin, alpha 1 n=1 Tax=Pygocentrus nattereri TaxID=42514 RepID=A0AAR2LX45_PYGNA